MSAISGGDTPDFAKANLPKLAACACPVDYS